MTGAGSERPTRRTAAKALSLALAVAASALGVALPATPSAAEEVAPYTVETIHFKVNVGPQDKTCDIVGDLYIPAGVTPDNRAPAILATNGFAGSKHSIATAGAAGFARSFADRGYVTLAYSGLGFGGSDCKVTLDHPDYDGVAGSQLISFLGGADGIAFADDEHTQPLPPLDVVQRDSIAVDGESHPHDPRVGMAGGSYGGHVQFAVASVDPRLDTIVPIYTWNDLTYTFAPNSTALADGVSSSVSGAFKLIWSIGFFALGAIDGVENAATDPGRLLPCPNYIDFLCGTLIHAATLGHMRPVDVERLRQASVASYIDKIRIPTLLMQGQKDTLFNLNEAIATYEALEAQGTEAKMIWQSWGHSDESPAPGEFDLESFGETTHYQAGRVAAWFDHHLKGEPVDTGPEFAYFRDWVDYDGNAAPAYGTSASFPVGSPRSFHLSGKSLSTTSTGLDRGSQSLVTGPGGLPLSLTTPEEPNVFGQLPIPELDLPGTTATWDSPALDAPLDVVGSPELNLKVSAPLTQLLQGPADGAEGGKLVLFIRVQDVAPDGTASDIHQLTAPVRVPDVRKPFEVTMPAIVHRFAEGHRVRLVVAGSSLNYRGAVVPHLVTIPSGSPDQVLTLPVVDSGDAP